MVNSRGLRIPIYRPLDERRSLLLFACVFGNTIRARNLNSLFCFTPNAVFVLEGKNAAWKTFDSISRYVSNRDASFRCSLVQNDAKRTRTSIQCCASMQNFWSALYVCKWLCASTFCARHFAVCINTQSLYIFAIVLRTAFTSRGIFRAVSLPLSLSDLVFRLFFFPLLLSFSLFLFSASRFCRIPRDFSSLRVSWMQK